MVDVDVVEKKPVTLTELKDRLGNIKKERNELNLRADRVYAYLEEFVDKKRSEDVYKKLSNLNIAKLKERHIVKIADMLPEDNDALKTIFVGDTISLKQEEMKQILDAING